MSARFAFTRSRGGDPEVLDVWDAERGLLNIGNVYPRGGLWAARRGATGTPDAYGFSSRIKAARWLLEQDTETHR